MLSVILVQNLNLLKKYQKKACKKDPVRVLSRKFPLDFPHKKILDRINNTQFLTKNNQQQILSTITLIILV